MAQRKRSRCALQHAVDFNLSRVAYVVGARTDRVVLSNKPLWQLALDHQVDHISRVLGVVESLEDGTVCSATAALSCHVKKVPLRGLCLCPEVAVVLL